MNHYTLVIIGGGPIGIACALEAKKSGIDYVILEKGTLVNSLYTRTQTDFTRGTFRVKGDTIDINLPYLDIGYRIIFFGDEIETIESFEITTGKRIGKLENAAIFPANLYVAPKDMILLMKLFAAS